MDQQCGNCRFALEQDGTDEVLCRQRPPSVILIGFRSDGAPNMTSVFPPMKTFGWCGCWEHKAPAARH